MRRLPTILVLLVLMAGFAFGVNRYFASRQAHLAQAAAPSETTTLLTLPGTMFIASNGDLYRLSGSQLTDLHMPAALCAWTQPAIIPGSGNILAVARTAAYSEVYLLSGTGQILQKLSHNQTKSSTIQLNHWMFWPRMASDGSTVYLSYDAPKTTQSYEIDFAIWRGAVGGNLVARQWTDPFGYTGGDVEAVPLANGDVLYAKYEISGGNVYSRLAMQTKAMADPVYLTQDTQDCAQPAVSPDGASVAMICTNGTGLQSTSLEVASLTGTTLGTPHVLVGGCICSAPSWAPDGSGLAYLAPADATGHFQLWWIAGAAGPTPAAAKQVTTKLDLDATAPPAWTQ